jgi:hypothetical protein
MTNSYSELSPDGTAYFFSLALLDTMWQFIQLTDIAELAHRNWKRAYKVLKFI